LRGAIWTMRRAESTMQAGRGTRGDSTLHFKKLAGWCRPPSGRSICATSRSLGRRVRAQGAVAGMTPRAVGREAGRCPRIQLRLRGEGWPQAHRRLYTVAWARLLRQWRTRQRPHQAGTAVKAQAPQGWSSLAMMEWDSAGSSVAVVADVVAEGVCLPAQMRVQRDSLHRHRYTV